MSIFDDKKDERSPLRMQDMPETVSQQHAKKITEEAVKDFMKIALARFPNLEIRLCPAPVQGKGAAEKLARAVRETDAQMLLAGFPGKPLAFRPVILYNKINRSRKR